ncbi:hypothetical protein ED312_07610 [Sinomicrobium pectinilyticum]|uniref:Uncharacterized protein n=1 Tax=Sinomicrobium pectinilyticum TaxID=1084421 RepID=A0A3N0EN44_SINP1|nr:hypothetical protein [Sinomicrobium pectinilyticum]RNL89157.1 hypothetical protein ED312_07610 [Sinomicrobium pectinilyticum]
MKLMLLIFFTTANTVFAVKQQEFPENIRKRYTMAPFNKEICMQTLDILENITKSSRQTAYLGAFQIISAKHLFNPFKKLKIFSEGKKNLEKAVAQVPDDVEVRFIRMSIQREIPGILNYKSDLEEDKKFIVNNYSHITDTELQDLIFNFLNKNDMLTPEEEKMLKR